MAPCGTAEEVEARRRTEAEEKRIAEGGAKSGNAKRASRLEQNGGISRVKQATVDDRAPEHAPQLGSATLPPSAWGGPGSGGGDAF